MPKPRTRAKLLTILAEMPDESFGWLLLTIAGQRGQIWPDGLGGFRPESRTSITKAITEARKITESMG